MAYLFLPSLQPALDVNGDRISGAKWRFCLDGTTTLTPVYTDETGTTTLTNPVVANSAGEFPNIFLNPDIAYRATLYDSDDIQLRDAEPIVPVVASSVAVDSDLLSRAVIVANRTALAALPTTTTVAFLTESGREGIFVWTSSDLSVAVTRDTEQGIYVPPTGGTGLTGAWVRKFDGYWNVRWFGATGVGNSHDDRPAIVGALNLLQIPGIVGAVPNTHGKSRTLYFPSTQGYYYISATIEVQKPVHILGDGADPNGNEYGTTIKCPAGVTPLYFTRKSAANNGGGVADGWVIENLAIEALGSNSSSTTATNVWPQATITLASASDFQNGQIVMIRGAGLECAMGHAAYWGANTTNGNNVITYVSAYGATEVPLGVGMHVNIRNRSTDALIFPTNTVVTSISGLNVTVSNNATATTTDGKCRYWEDRIAVIDSGGGTTTITVNERPTNPDGFSGHVIEHFDSAIYSEARGTLMGAVSTSGFAKGAGWVIHANGTMTNRFGQSPNANQCRQVGMWWTYSNRNGVRIQGNDANQCSFTGFDGYQNSEFQFFDGSFLGNQVHGAHCSSNLGYLTTNINARSTFVGCYTESGTNNMFAECTAVFGGIMGGHESNAQGGVHIAANVNIASLPTCYLYPPVGSTLNVTQGSTNLAAGIWNIDNSGRGGSADLALMRYSTLAADGLAGVFGSFDNASSRWGPGLTDSAHSRGAGYAVAPQGTLIGSGGDLTNPFRLQRYGTAAPASGAWVQGDRVFNSAPTGGGTDYWVCTVSGTPGTWVAKTL